MSIEEAQKLIVAFAVNQTRIVHAANSRRGVSKKLVAEERELASALLGNLTVTEKAGPTVADLDEVMKQLNA